MTILQNERLRIRVDSLGAQLCELTSLLNGTEYLWSGDPAYWSKHSPLLFPVIGGSCNGLRVNGHTYDMSKHGFARDMEFKQVEQTDNKLIYQLTDNDLTRSVYPYSFELNVIYTLRGNSLSVGYSVNNTAGDDMYFSIGAHPAFACPLDKDLRFDDYFLEFNLPETLNRLTLTDGLIDETVENYLDDTKIIALSHHLFDDDALVFAGLKSDRLTLKSNRSARQITVEFPGFTHLGIWSPKGDAPFVCIEPWYGIDDGRGFDGDISQKQGIVKLASKQTFHSEYTIICE